MSSATVTYGWSYAPPEETYRSNLAYLENLLGNVVKEIQQKAKSLSSKGIPAESLVSYIEDLADDILSEYSVDILKRPTHFDWVDGRVDEFNSLAMKIKSVISTLEVELSAKGKEESSEFYVRIYKSVPAEFVEIREFFKTKTREAVKKRIENNLHKLESLKEILKDHKEIAQTLITSMGAMFKELDDPDMIEVLKKLETDLEGFLAKLKSIDQSKDSDEIIKELYSITPVRFKEAREGLGKEIIKREVLKEVSSQRWKEEQEDEDIDVEVIKRDFSLFAEKVKALDEEAGAKISELEREMISCEETYRAKLLLEEVKKTYIEVRDKVAITKVLKEDIEELKKHIKSEELLSEAEELLSKKYIDRSEFFAFRNKVWKENIKESQKEGVSAEQVLSKLRELGYTIIEDDVEIKEGEVIELRTPYGEDYILKVKVQDGKITTKFVKVLEEERELSTYEKERDVYTAKKWCGDFDTLLEKLKEEGVEIDVKARVEPEERGIDYEVRKKDKKKSVREEKHGKPQQRRKSL